ncbi:hypothetical protein FH972_026004 [Carpinus fangiana]|uniref:non-specific serine/threonine protein kinase n=1 Tax=Carpinus fangiana TaxID=176857 RepID=A0A5N6L2N4_9ROSI|nr:hypothetical protein FH972_026004 [Carpinus fangiana]
MADPNATHSAASPDHAGGGTTSPAVLPPDAAPDAPSQPSVPPHLSHELSTTPDLLLSFQRPDGSMSTPRPDDLALSTSEAGPSTAVRTDDTHAAAGDYFSAFAGTMNHPVESLRRSSKDTTAESRRSSKSTDTGSHTGTSLPKATIAPQTSTAALPSTFTSTQQASSNPAESRRQPRRSLTEYPQYPNQAHAALQSQIYPDPHALPFAYRQGLAKIHPLQTTKHGLAIDRPQAWIDREGEHPAERGTRTAGNTPLTTPGTVFGLSSRPRRPLSAASTADETSPAPSPYLHPVQGHIPKETTRANRDVDTISGRKTINQYEIQHELGRGVHGKVKLARNLLTGEYVAIKIVQRHSRRRKLGKSTNPEDKVKREIAILKKTNHPNVVSLIEVIDDPEMTKIYIVLEFCDNHEVQWRTPGASEIVIMEHRRLEREKTGEDDIEATDDADRIMRAAQKRRERASRRKQKPLSRINSVSDFWSLEFQDESDDEDAGSQPSSSLDPSQASPLTLSTRLSRVQSAPAESRPAPEMHYIDNDDDVAPDDVPQTESRSHTYQHISSFDPDLHRQTLHLDQVDNHLNLSGHDRGRQHSSAESTMSRITEFMEEEIEEEHRYVPTMTLAESRAAFRDAVLGVEYLHYQGIVHRDIKPANLLRKADYRVKISDFGVSYLGKPIRDGQESEETSETETNEHQEDTELAKTVGTPAFYAPELCSLDYADENERRVTGQIDVWALGVTLYCLLYAQTPFTGDNEFMVMRHIAEEDVFISKKRLKAVDTRASSRSNSHGPLFRETREHRLPTELVYETIDEDLLDLLKRLFIKDPAKRISLTEIKHHPWVLRDIPRPHDWIEETTPHRQLHGKKIEISKEEVADAVIPLKVIERAKSMVRNVVGAFGFGSKSTRKRAPSNASSDGGSSPSLHNSDTSSGKGRRSSAFPGETPGGSMSSLTGQVRSTEHHPLSQSVTASPEAIDRPQFLEESFPFDTSFGEISDGLAPGRPIMPGRHDSSLSTAASIKTIRQVDIGRGRQTTPPPPLPPMQPMPLSGLEHIAEPNPSISTILGKAGESLMRSVRSRDHSSERSRSRTPSDLKARDSRDRLFGMPSTAVATASAAGHVHSPPSARKASDSAAGSATQSPISPRPNVGWQAVSSSDVTRATSPATSDSPFRSHHISAVNLDDGLSLGGPGNTITSDNTKDEDFQKALKRMQRRKQMEDYDDRRRSEANSRSQSSLDSACPPSPDDKILVKQQQHSAIAEDRKAYFLPLSSSMEIHRAPALNSNPVSSGSSAEQLDSGMSQSTSYPSAPSIGSANTDYPNPGSTDYLKDDIESTNSSDGTAHEPSTDKRSHDTLDDAGYTADHAIDDDGTDSDDSDADLVMMAPKRKTPLSSRSRRESHASITSGRSGSTHTVKKIPGTTDIR